MEGHNQHPGEEDGAGAKDREGVDDAGQDGPEGEGGDGQQIIADGTFYGDYEHDAALGANPALDAPEDAAEGVGDGRGEGEFV